MEVISGYISPIKRIVVYSCEYTIASISNFVVLFTICLFLIFVLVSNCLIVLVLSVLEFIHYFIYLNVGFIKRSLFFI